MEQDDDKTPPPTRNPFAAEAEDGLGAPPDEPKVQVAAELFADAALDETQGRGIPPPRPARPATPPPRPAAPTGSRPAMASAPPARRPAPPAPARPPPPVPSEELEDDDAPRELDSSEKTHIKPIPEKPRR
jgi:pilus assembly protein CpaF